jgi:transcriptional regulator with XRE-family HTH domain/tetratricopeptide (TPR) repeat protein
MSRTTGTKVERDQVRQALSTYGVAPAGIARELQRRFGLRPREAHRQAHGWTQDATAAHLNASVDRSATFTGARVSDYERWPFGGRRPTVPVLTALARLFDTTVDVLVDLDDLAEMPEAERAMLTRGSAVTGQPPMYAVPTRVSGDISPEMRWNMGGLLDETELVIAVTERTAGFGAWAEASNVGPFTMDDIAASTRRVAIDYLTQPPVAVYARAGLLADRVFRLLQTGHQPPDQERELYRWAGYLCSLLAWMAGDFGHPGAAESQARTGWLCAEAVGDKTLRAWALSTMSKIRLWEQRYEDAAETAARGFAQEPTGTAAVMLACQEADAWAEVGAGEQARAALDRAAEARQSAGRDSIGGLLACNTIRQHNYAGAVLLRIGAAAEAIQHADQALEAANGDATVAYGTLAQIRIWAASAHIDAGSLDGATDILIPVLELPIEQRLDTLARRLREVGTLINARASMRSSPKAQALRLAISEFCASSISRQLPA